MPHVPALLESCPPPQPTSLRFIGGKFNLWYLITYWLDEPSAFLATLPLLEGTDELFEAEEEQTKFVLNLMIEAAKNGDSTSREEIRGRASHLPLPNGDWEKAFLLINALTLHTPETKSETTRDFIKWLRNWHKDTKVKQFFNSEAFLTALTANDGSAVDLLKQTAKEVDAFDTVGVEDNYDINAEQLWDQTFQDSWLVEGVLESDQPCLVGGEVKTLKSSTMIDLAISLVSGTPFLGRYPATKSLVYFLSGEGGPKFFWQKMRNIAKDRGIGRSQLRGLQYKPQIPNLNDQGAMAMLKSRINKFRQKNGPGLPLVIIAEPVYLFMLDADANAANMFDVGQRLAKLKEFSDSLGATLILVHHTKTLQVGTKPRLDHLAFAGFKHFAGQWILLNRRTEFESGAPHQLFLSIGSRLGHSADLHLDIDERQGWRVTVSEVSEVKRATSKMEASRNQQRLEDLCHWIGRITGDGKKAKARMLREFMNVSGSTITAVLGQALNEGLVEMDDSDLSQITYELTQAGRGLLSKDTIPVGGGTN